jgi:hypothetical protein
VSRPIDRDALQELAQQAAADPGVPETVRRFLSGGAALEEIVLDPQGRWWHEGGAFENERLAELFHRSLRRTPMGTWLLEIAPYTYPVRVEGAPRFVRRLDLRDGVLWAILHGGAEETVPLEALFTDGDQTVGYVGDDGLARRVVGDAWRRIAAWLDADDEGWLLLLPDGSHRIRTRTS